LKAFSFGCGIAALRPSVAIRGSDFFVVFAIRQTGPALSGLKIAFLDMNNS
jgi:hypothetical protein